MGATRCRLLVRAAVTGVALMTVLSGCGTHHHPRPAPPPTHTSGLPARPAFTRVVRDGGCHRPVAPIHLEPLLRPSTDHPIGGAPPRLHLHHGMPPPTPGYPLFPRRLDGLPYRGYSVHEGGPEGVFYAQHPVDGRTFEGVLSHGALVVSAAAFTQNRERFLGRLPRSLTRVHVGRSRGWISQTRDPNTDTGVLYRSVSWLPLGVDLGLDGDRSAARLVALARSLVC